MKNVILFCFIFIFSTISLLPQMDPPIEWGEIPKEDLEMKTFPPDSNASALILCDYGESKFNDDFNIEFSRHLRVKILTQKGYEWGTHAVHIFTKDGAERIDDIEGITYNLSPSGEVIETELDDDDIFEEKTSENYKKYTFTLPALQPGSVIEIRYKIEAESIYYMRDWKFQHNEPVRWSEYRMRFPKNVAYPVVRMGYEPWVDNSITETKQMFGGEARSYAGDNAPCWQHRYVVKDAPAIRDEPYITTTDDYANRITVQLGGYSFPWTGKKEVLKDWNSLATELIESERFGEAIDVSSDVEELAAKITTGITVPEEKMKTIYDWVAKSIVCDERNRLFIDQDVDDVLEYKKGSNAEITILLLSILKAAGLDANPVILSTRENGKIQDLYPIASQFNSVIAKVNIGDRYYLLDATNALRPYDLLPSSILNVKAFVIKEKPEWIIVTTQKKNISSSIASLNISEDGTLSGFFEESFGEYKSIEIREDIADKKDADIAKELFDTESLGLVVDSVMISEKENISAPLRIKSYINSDSYFQNSGDMIYINPHILNRITENPFKSATRNFPIDYGYTRGYKTLIKITIPEGYELKEEFKPKSYVMDNSTFYQRNVQVTNNEIQILLRFDIKETEIKPNKYDLLKSFYAYVIASQSEQLVLGKKQTQQQGVTPAGGSN